jgi:effector-binding domain-containing protein
MAKGSDLRVQHAAHHQADIFSSSLWPAAADSSAARSGMPGPPRSQFRENVMVRLRAAASFAPATLLSIFLGLASALAQAPAPPVQSQPLPPPDAVPPGVQPAPAPSADPFGEEVMREPAIIVYLKGNGTWDSAFETLVDSFKSVYGYLDKEGIKPAGSAMTVYTSTDDTGFSFQAAVPIGAEPANPPRGDINVGRSPGGKMLKFVHRGSYDAMDTTYEAITNYLDTKQLEAQDLFVEEYLTDPVSTPEDKLVVNVFVPVK